MHDSGLSPGHKKSSKLFPSEGGEQVPQRCLFSWLLGTPGLKNRYHKDRDSTGENEIIFLYVYNKLSHFSENFWEKQGIFCNIQTMTIRAWRNGALSCWKKGSKPSAMDLSKCLNEPFWMWSELISLIIRILTLLKNNVGFLKQINSWGLPLSLYFSSQ